MPLISLQDVSMLVTEYEITRQNNFFYVNSLFKRSNLVYKKILEDINLSLNPGDRLALIGENGAGKTTLLKLMAGIKDHHSGSVTFSTKKRLLLGNHQQGFYPRATMRENMILNGLSKGISYKTLQNNISDMAEFIEMDQFLEKPIQGMSAGQKMRIALVVSLYSDADVYLIDEWIGSLDSYFFKKFNDKLVEKLTQSKSLVIASHNTELLEEMNCNKALYIKSGKIVAQGTLSDILELRR